MKKITKTEGQAMIDGDSDFIEILDRILVDYPEALLAQTSASRDSVASWYFYTDEGLADYMEGCEDRINDDNRYAIMDEMQEEACIIVKLIVKNLGD